MGVTIIFKIAAVGIVVTVLSQVLKHSGRGAGVLTQPCGSDHCAVLDRSLYQ